jgi:hypothetical protein
MRVETALSSNQTRATRIFAATGAGGIAAASSFVWYFNRRTLIFFGLSLYAMTVWLAPDAD